MFSVAFSSIMKLFIVHSKWKLLGCVNNVTITFNPEATVFSWTVNNHWFN